jgi:hypothetical protein
MNENEGVNVSEARYCLLCGVKGLCCKKACETAFRCSGQLGSHAMFQMSISLA